MLHRSCSRLSILPVLALFAASFFWGPAASAGGPESVFAGKVLILAKMPPSRFSSEGAFVSFLRSNSIKTVAQNAQGTWEFETMAFFKKPLGDYEVEIVFYDITDGKSPDKRRFVNSYPQYTQDRSTRTLSGKTKLIRPDFDANRTYMIVAQSRGTELAKGEFSTRGVSQADLDYQKRVAKEQADMEKSMRELEEKARQQEEDERKREEKANKKASENVF